MPVKIGEDLIQFLWKLQKFDSTELTTVNGLPTVIINPGFLNEDSGPDFKQARIKIDGTLWVGHIEIHINSSDWYRHAHHLDPAYNNVILHVVLYNDKIVRNSLGAELPTLVLKNRVPKLTTSRYLKLMMSSSWIPCSPFIRKVPQIHWIDTLSEKAISRLIRKDKEVLYTVKSNNGDWDQSFLDFLFMSLGGRVNKNSFLALSQKCPKLFLRKYYDRPILIEALLFGQSGLLPNETSHEYVIELKSEYRFLKRKHCLNPMARNEWQFSKMRPAGFPTIRIAQLSKLILSKGIIDLYKSKINFQDILKLCQSKPTPYWNTHYRFESSTGKSSHKTIGRAAVERLVINAIVPFTFSYARFHDLEELKSHAIHLMEQCSPEKNRIISHWKGYNVPIKNALDTQALIELKNEHCSKSLCLQCKIGIQCMSTQNV